MDGSGQVYQHAITIRPAAGSRWAAEGILSTTLPARQVALARTGKAIGADVLPGSHALRQWFEVSLSNDTAVLQGTKVEMLADRRDTKGEYKPDRFIVEVRSPGLMVGTWVSTYGTNDGCFFASLPGVLALPPPLTLERGKTHKLPCAGATNFHYTLYIPKSYDPLKPAPLLINDSPSANGQPLSTKMAEETGWIMAGLTESQNSASWWVCQGNCAGALFDIQRRLNIDASRIYFSGFSGGSRRCSLRALDFPDMTAGLICIGAGFAQWGEGPRQAQYYVPSAELPVFFIVGQTDMNFEEVTKRVHPKEVQRKRPMELVIHPGGHTWGRSEDHEAAIRWLQARGTNAAPVAAVR